MRKPTKRRPQGGYRPYGVKVKRRPETDVRAKVWQSMRVLGRFDVTQLMVTAEAKRTNAQDYIARLHAAGFLRLVSAGNASARRCAVYQLVRNSGPKAPITRKSGEVFDQNTDQVHAAGGAIVNKGERDGQASP